MIRALSLLTIVCAPTIARAGQATCSNPGLPIGAVSSRDLMPGRLTLNLTSSLLPINDQEVIQEGAQSIDYDTDYLLVETRLSAEYALTKNLAISASLPYRIVDVDVTTTPQSNSMIHIRDERLTGVADPAVGLHYAREVGLYRFHATVGTSIPLGSTVEDPHALGAIGQEHQHVQFGSGTFIPSIVLESQRRFPGLVLSAFGLAYLSLYENDKGYKQGHRISGGIAASAGFRHWWSLRLGFEVHGETAERWHGEIPMDEGNEGRVDFLFGPSLSYRFADGFALIADIKHPVYSYVVGNQVDYGTVFSLGIAAAFETKPRPSWHGLDQEALDPQSPQLTPVAGRVTVFDLWETWCVPCRELDEQLLALAKQHPELAVRKLEVGDSDSAAWKRYLEAGNYGLPHIKLYDERGTLVWERTAPPQLLIKDIEAFLRNRAGAVEAVGR